MKLSPIILFVYNRPEHTLKTLKDLAENLHAADSILHIFSDGPKRSSDIPAVSRVKDIIRQASGFKQIIIHEQSANKGLAKSVIDGVSLVLNMTDSAIVLEDDISTTPGFLAFMNNCLNKYEQDKRIFSVSGYTLPVPIPADYTQPVYLAYRGSSWGWGIWKDRWESIDWEIRDKEFFLKNKDQQKAFNISGMDHTNMLIRQLRGEIDSWAIRFAYNSFKQQKVHLAPVVSKVQNIGHDDSGVHSNKTNRFHVTLDSTIETAPLPEYPEVNDEINRSIYSLFKKPLYKRLLIPILRSAGLIK